MAQTQTCFAGFTGDPEKALPLLTRVCHLDSHLILIVLVQPIVNASRCPPWPSPASPARSISDAKGRTSAGEVAIHRCESWSQRRGCLQEAARSYGQDLPCQMLRAELAQEAPGRAGAGSQRAFGAWVWSQGLIFGGGWDPEKGA